MPPDTRHPPLALILAGLHPAKADATATKADEPDSQDDAGLAACARDLISAVHAKDEAGAAEALRSAFELLEAEPHAEPPQKP